MKKGRFCNSVWLFVVVCMAVLLPPVAEAHHKSNHSVLIISEWTKVTVQVPTCDSVEQVMDVLSPDTMQASVERYRYYTTKRNKNGHAVCGLATTRMKPLEVMYQTNKYSETTVTVLRFLAPDDKEYVALLTGIKVIEKKAAPEQGI